MNKIRFTDCVDIVGSSCGTFDGTKIYVSTGAVDTDHIEAADIEIIDYNGRPSRANLIVKENDIIFAKMQATTKTLLINKEMSEYIYSTGFCAVKAKRNIITDKCLYYLLTSETFLTQKDKNCSGATQKAITNTGLEKIEICIPDIEKQEKLVKCLDLICNIISFRKQQLQQLDKLVKARFVEMFGDPEHNEKKWDVLKLEALCSVSSSKRIYQNELSVAGVPFLRISDLVNRMDTGSTECELHIPEERYEELKTLGLVPTTGDVLLTARGTLGRCYIISESDRFYFQDGMITWLYDFDKSLTTNYLTHLFTMSGFRKQIDSLQAGSTVAYLSIAMTKKLDVMLPPIELQNEFAAFVRQIDKSKFAVQKALDEAQTLFDSLMQEYFG